MVKVQVYGPGCTKCVKQVDYVREAAAKASVEVELEKIEDMERILAAGVMLTPALMLNGQLVASGHIVPASRLEKLLQDAAAESGSE
ncbi:MAG: thioredoxin family protein [Planctomycetota bacterium]